MLCNVDVAMHVSAHLSLACIGRCRLTCRSLQHAMDIHITSLTLKVFDDALPTTLATSLLSGLRSAALRLPVQTRCRLSSSEAACPHAASTSARNSPCISIIKALSDSSPKLESLDLGFNCDAEPDAALGKLSSPASQLHLLPTLATLWRRDGEPPVQIVRSQVFCVNQ